MCSQNIFDIFQAIQNATNKKKPSTNEKKRKRKTRKNESFTMDKTTYFILSKIKPHANRFMFSTWCLSYCFVPVSISDKENEKKHHLMVVFSLSFFNFISSFKQFVSPYLSFDAMRRSFLACIRVAAWASCLDTFIRPYVIQARLSFISFTLKHTHSFLALVYWFKVENCLFDTDGFWI